MVDVEHRQLVDPELDQLRQRRLGDFVAGLEIDFAGLFVDQVGGEIAADQFLVAHQDVFKTGLAQPARRARRHPLARREHHLAGTRVAQIVGRACP